MVGHSCLLFSELFKVQYAMNPSLFNALEVFQPVFGPHPSLTPSLDISISTETKQRVTMFKMSNIMSASMLDFYKARPVAAFQPRRSFSPTITIPPLSRLPSSPLLSLSSQATASWWPSH